MKAPGLAFAGVFLTLLSGCTHTLAEPPGPVRSPHGFLYDLGTPPTQTRFSQTAVLYLQTDREERAAELALEGIAADPGNPIHYFLAGVTGARLGRYVEADTLLRRAQEIYPAYELDIEPERESAWAVAFNAGAQAFDEGDEARAIAHWEDAVRIFDLRPEAHLNLAMVRFTQGDHEGAIAAYTRALEGLRRQPATRIPTEEEERRRTEAQWSTEEGLVQVLLVAQRFEEAEPLLQAQYQRDPTNVQTQSDLAAVLSALDRDAEAEELYRALLGAPDLEATQLFNLGIALFRATEYARAGQAFGRLVELRPDSRDVWFNYTNALFAAGDWEAMLPAAERLLTLDPLNENAGLILARAHLERGDEPAAIAALDRVDSAPVHLAGLLFRPSAAATSIVGRVSRKAAPPGTPVRLRFLFLSGTDLVGEATLEVQTPAEDEVTPFEVTFRGTSNGFRYEVLPLPSEGPVPPPE
jgi:tetratricopeptide (TPR) repeat protein